MLRSQIYWFDNCSLTNLALFRSVVDQNILCSHYKLDGVCATSDIGEADDLVDMCSKHRESSERGHGLLRFNARDIMEAQEEEDQQRVLQEEKLRAQIQRAKESGAKLSMYEESILNGGSMINKFVEAEDLSEETKVVDEIRVRASRRRKALRTLPEKSETEIGGIGEPSPQSLDNVKPPKESSSTPNVKKPTTPSAEIIDLTDEPDEPSETKTVEDEGEMVLEDEDLGFLDIVKPSSRHYTYSKPQ